MVGASDPGPSAQAIEDEILDALTSAHVVAGSIGLTLRQLRDAAISGSTTNSLMDKIRGATTGQLFASAGLSDTYDNADFSMTASQTVEIIPASGESDTGLIWVRTSIAADTLEFSADSGTNYRAINAAVVGSMGRSFGDAGGCYFVLGIGDSTGRYRIVATSGVGTRNIGRAITTVG